VSVTAQETPRARPRVPSTTGTEARVHVLDLDLDHDLLAEALPLIVGIVILAAVVLAVLL
jgi:hypothetical protein